MQRAGLCAAIQLQRGAPTFMASILVPQEMFMSPMSLVTLPPDALLQAQSHAGQPAPEAERVERQFALAVCLVMIAASIGMFLGG
jgi:hypothetical protein